MLNCLVLTAVELFNCSLFLSHTHTTSVPNCSSFDLTTRLIKKIAFWAVRGPLSAFYWVFLLGLCLPPPSIWGRESLLLLAPPPVPLIQTNTRQAAGLLLPPTLARLPLNSWRLTCLWLPNLPWPRPSLQVQGVPPGGALSSPPPPPRSVPNQLLALGGDRAPSPR